MDRLLDLPHFAGFFALALFVLTILVLYGRLSRQRGRQHEVRNIGLSYLRVLRLGFFGGGNRHRAKSAEFLTIDFPHSRPRLVV